VDFDCKHFLHFSTASTAHWVRARGMAIYQMAMMGGNAIGAILLGNIAAILGVQMQ